MSTSRSNPPKFVPVSELPTLEQDPSAPVTWDFSLPPSIDIERIEMNMHHLGRIQKMGAFISSHVIGYDGETSSYTPGIAGINANGTALASRSVTGSRAPVQYGLKFDEFPSSKLMGRYGKTRSIHFLNKAEIVSKVVDSHRSGRNTYEQAWAAELNTALDSSIRSVARQHLVTRASKFLLGWDALYFGGVGAVAYVDDAKKAAVAISLGLVSALVVGADSVENKVLYGETLLKERRWSLFAAGSQQADRYLAVAGLTYVNDLLRVAK